MWKTVKLGNVANWYRGLTYSKKDEVMNNGLGVLRATNIDLATHNIVLDDIRLISKSVKVQVEKYAQVGDLLICTASGSKSHVGKIALIKEDLGMAFGGFMAVIRCYETCIPAFLYQVMTSRNFKYHLNSLSDGANINNLKFSQIESFEFPIPPLEEQKQIVKKLDAINLKKDSSINALNSQIDNYIALKLSILSNSLKSPAL